MMTMCRWCLPAFVRFYEANTIYTEVVGPSGSNVLLRFQLPLPCVYFREFIRQRIVENIDRSTHQSKIVSLIEASEVAQVCDR